MEEGLFLTKYGKKIIMVVRRDDFSINSAAVEELKENPKVELHFNTEVARVEGDSAVRRVVLKDRKTGEETVYESGSDGFYGVYAAGDICVKELRQVVTAVSDGAVAATSLEKYLGSQYRKLQLKRTYVKKLEPKEEPKPEAAPAADDNSFLDADTRAALAPVLGRFTNPITLRLYDDHSDLSREDAKMIKELASLSDKVSYEVVDAVPGKEHTIAILNDKKEEAGLRFHGVPGGHEFNSFILVMYNVAGPGQDVGEALQKRIDSIDTSKALTIAVSLSCTMCPDLVAAAERIAADNPNATVDVYDLAHYPELQKKWNIMSVPCLIVNDKDVHFGKKGGEGILDMLK